MKDNCLIGHEFISLMESLKDRRKHNETIVLYEGVPIIVNKGYLCLIIDCFIRVRTV